MKNIDGDVCKRCETEDKDWRINWKVLITERLFDAQLHPDTIQRTIVAMEAIIKYQIAQDRKMLLKGLLIKDLDSRLSGFTTTVNQYIVRRAEELGVDVSDLLLISEEESVGKKPCHVCKKLDTWVNKNGDDCCEEHFKLTNI